VQVDGENVKRIKFIKNELHWTRKTSGGKYEHGFVHFAAPHFLHGSGHLVITKDKLESEPVNKHSLKPVSFHLTTTPAVTPQPVAAPAESATTASVRAPAVQPRVSTAGMLL
jgi:hypothetical protein